FRFRFLTCLGLTLGKRCDPIDHLLHGESVGIEVHGVRSEAEGRVCARAVAMIALADFAQYLVEVGAGTLAHEVPEAPPGALLRACVEVDLHFGVGEDYGSNIPPLHDDAALRGQAALLLNQRGTDAWNRRDL